jgi:translation initiation factor 2 gamma subunit (eIF-2gamma)
MKQWIIQAECEGGEVNERCQGPQSSDVLYIILSSIYHVLILQVKIDIINSRESAKVSKE